MVQLGMAPSGVRTTFLVGPRFSSLIVIASTFLPSLFAIVRRNFVGRQIIIVVRLTGVGLDDCCCKERWW